MALRAWVEKRRRRNKAGNLVVVGYRVKYRDAAGVQRSEPGCFEKEDDAKTLRDKVNDRLRSSRLGECDPHLKTDTAIDSWLNASQAGQANKKGKRIQESTAQSYRENTRRFREAFPLLSALEESTLEEWAIEVSNSGLADWTVSNNLKDVRTFLTWAHKKGMLAFDPRGVISITQPIPLPRYYNDAELDAFDGAAPGDGFELAYYLGIDAAMRRSEVLRFDTNDLRWLENGTCELLVWADESKNGEYRTIPLTERIVAKVKSMPEGRPFENWSFRMFEYAWAKFKAKAGIQGPENHFSDSYAWASYLKGSKEKESARFHDLRHTFCRLFIESGAGELHKLSKITGHKSQKVLERIYGHFQTGALHEALAVMQRRRRLPVPLEIHAPEFGGQMGGSSTEKEGASGDNRIRSGTSDPIAGKA